MPQYFEFEVSLLHIKPRIWRRFLLAADATTFQDLNNAIQGADTWESAHLWQFREPGRRGRALAGMSIDDMMGLDVFGNDDPPADEVLLSRYFTRKGIKCVYEYDFGDGWEHEIVLKQKLELPEKFHRRLVAGQRAFPPEDCGGAWGYYACLAAVKPESLPRAELDQMDPADLKERREWLEDWDPEAFHLDEIKESFDANSPEDVTADDDDDEDDFDDEDDDFDDEDED